MCRCNEYHEERYGKCWINVRDFTRIDWSNRLSLNFEPFAKCNYHSTCTYIDMNMICSSSSNTCECREHMKWNTDVLECQIFIDVDCSNNNNNDNNINSTSTYNDNNIENNEMSNKSYKEMTLASKPSSAILRKYEISLRNRPISFLTPSVTLDRSMLLSLDLTKTNSKQAQKIFCRELTAISRRYGILKRKRLITNYGPKKQSNYIASSKNNLFLSNTFVIILLQTILEMFS